MKKQWRMVIISGCVLVALLLAWLLATVLKPGDTSETTTTTTASVPPVFEAEDTQISKVEFKSENGTLTILTEEVKDSEGNVIIGWNVEGGEDYPLDSDLVESLAGLAKRIYTSEEIASYVNDFEPYGLDEPRATMTVWLKSGETHIVKFGNELVSGYYDYVSLDDTGRICKVASTTCARARQTMLDLLDKDVVVDIAYTDLTHLVFERARDQLRVAMDCTLMGEGDNAYLDCVLTEPIKRAGRSESLNTLASEGCAITVEEYVALEPEDLSVYGLDQPQYTYVLQTIEKTVTVKIGKLTGSGYYAISDVVPAVFTIPESSFSIIDMSVIEMLDRFVNLESIWDVEKIEANLFGTTFTTEIAMTKDQKAEDEEVVFKLDGQNAKIFSEKDSSLFSKFYQRIISVYISGLDTEAQPVNKHEASLTFFIKEDVENGIAAHSKVIEFTKRDDYTYYVFIDDVYAGFYVDYVDVFTETRTDDEGLIIAYKKLKYAIEHAVDGVFDTSKGYQID